MLKQPKDPNGTYDDIWQSLVYLAKLLYFPEPEMSYHFEGKGHVAGIPHYKTTCFQDPVIDLFPQQEIQVSSVYFVLL